MRTPRRRPGESSQAHGSRWERAWAKMFGVDPQKGSGSLWYAKLDVADGSILWSLKHTDAASFRVTTDLMHEVQSAISGSGGVGGDTIPGLAISVQGEPFVVLRAGDFMRMVTQDVKHVAPPADEVKRRRAAVPALMRDRDD